MKVSKINALLAGLTEGQLIYTNHVLSMGFSIRKYIKDSGVSKENFIAKFGIAEKDYQAFTNGGWNYDCHNMASLNAAVMELEIEKAKDKVPVKFPKYDYQEKI